MHPIRALCLTLFTFTISACSGSSSDLDSVCEGGICPDAGSTEAGNQDAITGAEAGSDAALAKADAPAGDAHPATFLDAGLRDGTAGTPTDAPLAVVDTAAAPDRPAVLPDAGRDVRIPDAALPTTTDAAVVKLDTFPSSGNATVDRLALAAASCGAQSIRTVPVGWQMVVVGEKGCTMEAPPTWLAFGAGSPTTFVVEDQTRVTGSSVMAGVDLTNTVTCTPHGVVAWMFAKNTDCVGFKELDWKEKVVNVAGLLIPEGDLVYSCTQGGVPVVGWMAVQIHGTSPWCNMLVEAFWTPETQIESRTCTLTQTLNSLRCPQGGTGCDDSTCRNDCILEGNASGACTADGSCTCTN